MSVVSVIIPTYNRAHLLGSTLDSVLSQSFTDWECIVVDDGSADATPELMEFYCLMDSRIKFFSRPQEKLKGASSCRNYGIEKAQGDFIQFLDSDDLISQNKIFEQVKKLKVNNDFTISTCAWGRLKEKKFEKYKGLLSYSDFHNIPDFLNSLTSAYGYFPLNAYLFTRKLVTLTGPWNENIHLNDDGEYIMRLLCKCERIVFAPTSTAKYRVACKNNLSSFGNFKGVETAVYSWKLIDANLKIRFGNKANKFVDWSKGKFFLNLLNYYPQLIEIHSDFFSKQIKMEKDKSGFFFRFKNKIGKILK